MVTAEWLRPFALLRLEKKNELIGIEQPSMPQGFSCRRFLKVTESALDSAVGEVETIEAESAGDIQ